MRAKLAAQDNLIALTHPASTSAAATRLLVLTAALPEENLLANCAEEIRLVAETTDSPESMLAARDKVSFEVKQAPATFHWCFYKMIVDLDDQLRNDNIGVLLEERAENFLKEMKALWLLSMGLDLATKTKHSYFSYLRRRYIDLSRSFYGRDVEVLGLPLGHVPNKPQSRKKAAGEADVDL